MPAMVLPPPRLSISERKAIPGLDLIPSRLAPSRPQARKELNFEDDKENKQACQYISVFEKNSKDTFFPLFGSKFNFKIHH